MFTFTDEEWELIFWTDIQTSAQSHIPVEKLFLTLDEATLYYDETPEHAFHDDVLVKLCKRFMLEVSEFEDEGYYKVCTNLDWDEAQALITKMRVHLTAAGYEV